jgi:hypothetical protein
LTRETLKRQGRHCDEFSKIAIVVLNQVVRPFTAKWHRESLAGAFQEPERCKEFREDLAGLQQKLREYTKMLADMAGVEDLTELEQSGESKEQSRYNFPVFLQYDNRHLASGSASRRAS